MRSVVVTKFVPTPPNSGGKQRSLAIVERLARRGPTVLCAFDDGTADRSLLERQGVEVRSVPWRPTATAVVRGLAATRSATSARFWDAALKDAIRAAVRGQAPDVLQVEYMQLAPYARGVEARTRVLDLHNVESALVDRMAALRGAPARLALRLEARRLHSLEREALSSFDAVSVVSAADRSRLGATDTPLLVCPNGNDVSVPEPMGEEPLVVFVGLLGWGPNADAAIWLARTVWPLVVARAPGAKLLLVGRDPSDEVRALAGTSVEVTGTVPDVTPLLDRARVATAPLRAGGGSRLKILEALGRARPVVATSIGAEGLEDLVGSGVVVEDSAEGTAGAIVSLLENPARAEEVGRTGYEAVRDRYGWNATLKPLFDLLDERAAR